MKTYTEQEQAEIGNKIAELFQMRKSASKGRFLMTWGDKTPLGIFHTFQRIAEMIEKGEEIKP